MQVHKLDKVWNTISNWGIANQSNPDDLIRFRILNQVGVLSMFICALTIPFYVYEDCTELLMLDFACIAIGLLALGLNYYGYNNLAWHSGLVGIPLSLAVVSFFVQPVPGLALIALSFIIIIRYLYKGQKIINFYYGFYGLISIIIILSPVFGGEPLQNSLIHNFIQSIIGVTLQIIFSDLLSGELSKSEAQLRSNEHRIKNLLKELEIRNSDLEQQVQHRTASLLKVNADLQISNQELKRFAYASSHDLQEPLRMIGSFVQLLDRRYGDKIGSEGKEYINYALEGSRRMSALIRSILQYEELNNEQLKIESVNLRQVIERGIQQLYPIIEEKNAKIQIEKVPAKISCEPTEIGLVFYNLIHNSLIFNKSKSPNIKINGEEQQNEWMISVKDNGIGIEPEYKEEVFRAFQRLNNREEYSGAGMGLPLCQRIVERHKGRIWLTSELGLGTTVFLTINKNINSY